MEYLLKVKGRIMQIILTEEEYNTFKSLADSCEQANKNYFTLLDQYAALKIKYDKLLIHGVVTSNEQLKSTLKQG